MNGVIYMPRKAREKSETGIYHIILRGANRQDIFHDEEDRMKFLEVLEKYKQKTEIEIYGWCLMDNHVHLLFKEGNEELSVTMKRIAVSFVWYYNGKYNTSGHLFQDRFKSEKVESDQYLLTVIRYIHQNPVKAGMVKNVNEWKWSSSFNYCSKSAYSLKSLLDSDFVLNIFSTDRNKALVMFKEFNEAENADQCLEDEVKIRMTDEAARQEIIKLIEGIEIAQVKSLPKVKRDEILRKAKGIDGITQRQAARILGVSPNLIFKA